MEYWQHHNQQMYKLKQIYNRVNKQTQNKLQELLDTFNFNSDTLYNICSNKDKRRINSYIELWKEQGLLKNNSYFSVLAKNIYNRTRVKNNEILELLIYGAYIEEQSKLDEYEKQIMYDDINHYYQEGQKQIKKKKEISILEMTLFLYLLDQPLYNGYTFKQNIEVMIRYNAEQVYKQCLINIIQGKENDIDNSIFQNIIKRQNNQKLCINNDKISGSMDLTLIGLNNKAIVEGIKLFDKNAKVQFISDRCDNVTPMCMNMDRMIFNVNSWNEFTRYVGTSIKDIRQEKVKIFGLVQGVNMPPVRKFLPLVSLNSSIYK